MNNFLLIGTIFIGFLLFNIYKISERQGTLDKYIDTLDTFVTLFLLLTMTAFDFSIGVAFFVMYLIIGLLELVGGYNVK